MRKYWRIGGFRDRVDDKTVDHHRVTVHVETRKPLHLGRKDDLPRAFSVNFNLGAKFSRRAGGGSYGSLTRNVTWCTWTLSLWACGSKASIAVRQPIWLESREEYLAARARWYRKARLTDDELRAQGCPVEGHSFMLPTRYGPHRQPEYRMGDDGNLIRCAGSTHCHGCQKNYHVSAKAMDIISPLPREVEGQAAAIDSIRQASRKD